MTSNELKHKAKLQEWALAVQEFIDRKRAEGKHYYSYMTAGSAKFLRIYYARVKEHLNALEHTG